MAGSSTPGFRGDWFVDLFTSEAEKLIDYLSERLARRGLGLEPYWWVPGLPAMNDGDAVVAAVDGGSGIVPLAGGGALYVARAYGYAEGFEAERLLEMRFYWARDTRILDALRSWVEHRVAVRLALRLPQGSVLLMDGSLWALVTLSLRALARLARGRIYSLGGVYTGLLSCYTLAEVVKLVELVEKRGITLAYISKDHSYQVLKEKILLDLVAEKAQGLAELVKTATNWYPLAGREALLEARRLVPEAYKPLYDLALDPSYRDSLFVRDTAGHTTGYTWQLTLPPPRDLAEKIVGREQDLVGEAVDRTRRLIPGEPEAAELEALAEKLPQVIGRLPGVRIQYARFNPNDNPLLVEQPDTARAYHEPGRLLEKPDTKSLRLVALLSKRYTGPDYYNIPLVVAHINASLHSQQLEAYVKLLEQLAATRGVSLETARRTKMPGARRGRRLPQGW